MTEEEVRQALRDCYDPEFALNVIELGLVESIDIQLDHDAPGAGIAGVPDRFAVNVKLLHMERAEGLQAQLAAVVHNRLAGLPYLSRIEVTSVQGLAWSPSEITPAGRQMLRLEQPHFPILNNRADKLR